MNRYNVELEEYSMYSVYSTSKIGVAGVAGVAVIDFNDFGLLFLFHLNWNRWSSKYLFQLFLFLKNLKRIMQSKICTSFAHLLFGLHSQWMLMGLLLVRRLVMVLCQKVLIKYWGCC